MSMSQLQSCCNSVVAVAGFIRANAAALWDETFDSYGERSAVQYGTCDPQTVPVGNCQGEMVGPFYGGWEFNLARTSRGFRLTAWPPAEWGVKEWEAQQ